jgi:hypothetical protein
VLNDDGDNRLTLTTCNPKYSASQRLVVVATLRSPSTAPLHHPVHEVHVVAGSAGWNLKYLPGALLLVALLVGLGLMHGRISGHLRQARWLVLGPIWLAGIFLLFVELSALLPATL